MIKVQIGSSERSLEDADPNWINEQINRRRQDKQAVCVRIVITEPGVNVALATPGCDPSSGGMRLPNSEEKEILDLWKKLGLDTAEFAGGNLVAFLSQLRRVIKK